jgi:cytochrome P450
MTSFVGPDIASFADDAASGAAPRRAPRTLKAPPFIGVLPQFFRNPTALLLKAAEAHPGEIVTLPVGPARIHLLTEPRHVQHVLSDNWRNYVKGAMWKPTRRLMGNGLVTSEGESWLRSRRLVQPLFTPKNLASLTETLVGSASRASSRLVEFAGGASPVDVANEMMRLVQVVFLEALFGSQIPANDTDALGGAIVRALEAINLRAFLYFLPEWVFFAGERELKRNIAKIDETVLRIVQDRRARPQGGRDLVSLLLAARDEGGSGMDDRQLRDELVTLFVAGNDTTAVAMTWLWYVLDAYPEVDSKVRAELHDVLAGRAPTFSDLAKLTYTTAVIQETMRLYPVGWIIPRVAERDDVIDGFEIAAGSTVLTSQFVTHRSARHWDRPTEFDPGRFEPARVAERSRFAYFPFGGGPRQCMGSHFAMMMMQVIVAILAPRLRMRRASNEPVVAQSTITLRPQGGLKMNLTAL